MKNLSKELLNEVSISITKSMGLYFSENRLKDLERNIYFAAKQLGFKSAEDCAKKLLSNSLSAKQLEDLASHMTVSETYFFRDPASFTMLEQEVLPRLMFERSKTYRSIRMWSAGCCSGEEAYSLAISIIRTIPELKEWNISILATDINQLSLAKAEQGIYSDWSFRSAPTWLKPSFFKPIDEKRFQINSNVKSMVSFAYLNFALDTYPALHNHTNAMDIIFCRNVLMYFTPEFQKKVIDSFYQCLVEGGILMVNPAEAGALLLPKFTMENHDGLIVYRKTRKQIPTPLFKPEVFIPPPKLELEPMKKVCISEPLKAQDSACYEFANDLLNQGKVEMAFEEFVKVADSEPDCARSSVMLARILANKGELEGALTWCRRATKIEPTNLEGHFLFATVCCELGKEQEAITAFCKVLFLDQNFILAHHALGGLYKQIGRLKQSHRHYSIAIEILSSHKREDVIPETKGMTCGRLAESIRAIIGEKSND